MLSPLRLLTGLVLLAAATLALGAAAALAAPRDIAYGCGLDICLVNPDNAGEVTNLTHNEGEALEQTPTWSPDGKKLAFVAYFPGKPAPTKNVYVMEPDAAGQTINVAVQVTHYADGGNLGEPAWSPDGSRIAFTRGNSVGTNSVWVANSDGSTPTPVQIAEHGEHPSWAPDGGKIAYSANDDQVYLRNADASAAASLLPNGSGHAPAWSPDGSRIAFDGKNANGISFVDLHVVTVNGNGTPVVVPDGFSEWTEATWSPDSARIAYLSRDGAGADHVRVVNADGGGDHPLENAAGIAVHNAPTWSPDGVRVAFESVRLNNPMTSADDESEVYLANGDGSGGLTPLASTISAYSNEPAWRPNPVAHPAPQVITPSGGSTASLPGPVVKPKLVWFTNRIPWSQAPYVPLLSVSCGDISCGANATGKMKGAMPAGLRFRPLLASASGSGKPKKPKSKPKPVIVGRGKVQVPAGQKRTLKLKLTKVAKAVLEQVGKLKMVVTITITAAGAKPVTQTHALEIFAKPKSAKQPKKNS